MLPPPKSSQSPSHTPHTPSAQNQQLSDAQTIGLRCFSVVMEAGPLRDRFMSLTGYGPDDLRAALSDATGQARLALAVLEFLVQNEADLLAAASELDADPAALHGAWQRLSGPSMEAPDIARDFASDIAEDIAGDTA